MALTLNIDAATSVTVSAIDNGGQDISIYHRSNMCDSNSCVQNGFDSLEVPVMAPTDALIVEAGIGYPPEQLEISITCGN